MEVGRENEGSVPGEFFFSGRLWQKFSLKVDNYAQNWPARHVNSQFLIDQPRTSALGAAVELLFSPPPVCHLCSSDLPLAFFGFFQLDFFPTHVPYLFLFAFACVCLHFHPIPLERAWKMNRIGHFGDSLPIESGFTYTAAVLFCLSLIFWCSSPFIFRFCAQKIDNVYTVKVFLISEALVKILILKQPDPFGLLFFRRKLVNFLKLRF